MSLASQGGVLTTGPPGKSLEFQHERPADPLGASMLSDFSANPAGVMEQQVLEG